jgi:hypothetical protein
MNERPRDTPATPSDPGRPAVPRRPPLHTPSALNLFRKCPEAYHLRYVARQPAPEIPSPALARGIAVHDTLAACAREYQRRGTLPTGWPARLAAQLPRAAYPEEAAWRADLAASRAQVAVGLAALAPELEVVAVERFWRWTWPGTASGAPFTLGAKVDLVLAGTDDRGARYLDIVDYATGQGRRIDRIQELVERLVVKANLVMGGEYAYIVSTTAWLASAASWSAVRDEDECRATWREIRGLAHAIATDPVMAPTPSALCQWCDYYGNGCLLDRPRVGEPDAGQDLARWLDATGDEAGEAKPA